MTLLSLTSQQGLEIQRQHLAEWKVKLKDEVYLELEYAVKKETERTLNTDFYLSLPIDQRGYMIPRGSQIDSMVLNIKPNEHKDSNQFKELR